MSSLTLTRPVADPAFAYAAGAAVAGASAVHRLPAGTIPGGYSAVAGTVGRHDRTGESVAAATAYATGAPAPAQPPVWLRTLAEMVLGRSAA